MEIICVSSQLTYFIKNSLRSKVRRKKIDLGSITSNEFSFARVSKKIFYHTHLTSKRSISKWVLLQANLHAEVTVMIVRICSQATKVSP